MQQVHKGLFTNYVDKILAFFDHLTHYVDIFYGINIDKKWTVLDLSRLVNVVCEQPPKINRYLVIYIYTIGR